MPHNLPILTLCRKCLAPVLAGTLVFASISGVGLPHGALKTASAATTAATYKLVQQAETMVTSGAKQVDYQWVSSNASETTQLVHVLQIDLTNPYVQLNAMSGKASTVTTRQSVGGMAKETGAVAGINGDVFNTSTTTSEGVAMGAVIRSGELLTSTSQLTGMYAFAVTKDKQPLIDLFNFTGMVTAEDGTSFALSGLNQSAYRTEPDNGYSHVNKLYIYTDNWTASQRPMNSGTTPTEALIVNGVVTEIAKGSQIATAIPANGYILRGHKEAADFIANHLAVGQTVNANYQLVSQTTGTSYDPSSFQMMVGGHTILINNGAAATFSRDISGLSGSSDRPRTAVGYSKDGKTVYLITVEESGDRKGVTLKELQQILLKLGVYKAVNMDGGGSTTMVTRPLGETAATLTHPTSSGTYQRLVANGIGVYTTAPQGAVKGIVASGTKTLFIGQQATYSLKAYDTYYNPIDASTLTPAWSVDGAVGTFASGVFTATKAGTAKLTVAAGSAKNTVDIEVIGGEQLSQLSVNPSTTLLQVGQAITVPVTATLKDGRALSVPSSAITWEFKGFTADYTGGQLVIKSVNENAANAYAIARYDGFSTMIVLAPGTEKKLEDFENAGYTVSFTALPAETGGAAFITDGLTGRETTKALELDYDFTLGSGDRRAYAVLGSGLSLDGSPSALTLDVMGDNSNSWLRGEVTNSDGSISYLTIADKVNWTGWKTVRVDLSSAGIKAPAKLTKLYVVNLAEDQDERATTGTVAFDNLALQYPPTASTTTGRTVILTVGSKEASVGGNAVAMDTAPYIQANTTYVPLRFISEALGGQADWEQTLKRVTVLRGSKMIELWPDRADMIATGVRVTAPASPMVQNGRVLVPLRVVSEQLGLTVVWEQTKKSITIY
ncbi:stalk domain-containing protein [Cohnella fermenti]|uniref:Copper amine oxidase n=1 Tax=Cohnella fermenti TaxID=2565925 RepID=A0A4S4C550_9BACL|nr:stalk domain-containing protein [Cohnella fermenti]THF80821.1 copper amine oxidase [Cohnella fermenti]